MKTVNRPQYITQINAFHRFTESHYLTPNARLLWFSLIDLFNRTGWPEWVQVDTLRLTAMLDVSSRNAAFRARDALVEAGLLEYEPGTKGYPTRYRMIFFPCTACTENGTEYGTKSEPKTEPKTEHIIRQDKEKDERRKENIRVPAALCETFRAYTDMRKKMRKPLTDHAASLALGMLESLAPGRYDEQKKILEQSILNGWAGLYPLKKEQAPEPPASYDVGEFERRLLYGKIEYRKRI